LAVDSRPQSVNFIGVMNRKHDKIAALIQPFQGRAREAHYLAFFDCFNRQRFYEAHEVLEALWLPQRHGPNGAFYKGLIQLAGAFVHVQNSRIGPAFALLRLAQTNLQKFPATHEGLDLGRVLGMIEHWKGKLASACPPGGRLSSADAAELRLRAPAIS
jgi:hypothetical protein